MTRRVLAIAVSLCCLVTPTASFLAPTYRTSTRQCPTTTTSLPILRHISSTIASYQQDESTEESSLQQDQEEEEEEIPLVKPQPPVTGMERAWRHAKKPLLSIGAKGATLAHGNSLRQLLEAHGAVKVKINTKHFDNSLDTAFDALKQLAMEAGAPEPELLHVRYSDNIILVGAQGIRAKIESNEFPPEVVEYVREERPKRTATP